MIPESRFQHLRYKLKKNLHRRGVWGTLQVCIFKFSEVIRDLAPQYRRFRMQEREFDRLHGVKTDCLIALDELDVWHRAEPGRGYQPTPAGAVQPILNELDIDYGRFTFVDLGCGMGRVLLIASHFPFKKIIGVDFSAELQQVAEQNIRMFKSENQRCRQIELVCTDAAEYRPPAGDTVFYLFNPFGKPILERVLKNIKHSLESSPHDVLIVYYNSVDADLLENSGFLEKVSASEARPGVHSYAIYRSRRESERPVELAG